MTEQLSALSMYVSLFMLHPVCVCMLFNPRIHPQGKASGTHAYVQSVVDSSERSSGIKFSRGCKQ